MITQNSLLDFFAKSPSVSQGKKLNVGIEKSSNTQFKDTFNSALDNVHSSDTKKYNSRDQKNDVTGERKEKFDNYREVQMNGRRREDVYRNKSIKNSTEKISEDHEDSPGKDEAKNSNRVKSNDEMYMDIFANILGMNPTDLNKVLDSMNIKPEDLTDSTKISDIINKLSSELGLDDQQKQALSDILKMIKNQMDSCMGKQFEDNMALESTNIHNLTTKTKANNDSNWSKAVGTENGSENKNQTVTELNQITARLKSKIEELSLKMILTPQELSGEFAEEIRNIMAQYSARQINTGINELQVDDQEIQNQEQMTLNSPNDSAVKSSKPGNELGQDAKETKDQGKKSDLRVSDETRSSVTEDSRQEKSNVFQNINTKVSEGNNTEISNTLQNNVQKNTGVENTVKVIKEIPISKNELFGQIIEKAKVVTSGEKSEMLMELKPESLGKLSLKIVTEHGIVSAKFIAENQQVKEVIETNMQLLKDSLEKQGLSVQGFSVSVGQQSSNGFRRESGFKEEARNSGGRIENVTKGITGTSIVSDNLERVNPYNRNENRINLTA